ncbi:hypothetical protein RHGRI_014632 [Rhododendron griersonianum]|uniref:Uncharacterized protein n=1 Tax=Rhododendron griersonianum TaxID=479676 RepID=A0AAV6KA33_9ERIC|nr:hypothetical protein RHGRI_014632 [Rhododendron griersonianum]
MLRYEEARCTAATTEQQLQKSPPVPDQREIRSNIIRLIVEDNNLEGVKDEYWRNISLLKAALRGDWDAARRFLVKDERAITAPITNVFETVLHIAVGIGERAIHFVEKLVVLMPVGALILREKHGDTALHTASMVGNTRAAVVLVKKNPDLLYIRRYVDRSITIPLCCFVCL